MVPHTVVAYALVMLVRDNSLLMLKRSAKNSFAPQAYSLPGGKVEKDESFRQAAIREINEELGIILQEDDLEFVHTFYRKGTEHELVACIFRCRKWQGEPSNKEPDKHDEMKWIDADQLPENIVPAHRKVWQAVVEGKMYSEHF
jgi:8-oxo-dGTP diphosphatase